LRKGARLLVQDPKQTRSSQYFIRGFICGKRIHSYGDFVVATPFTSEAEILDSSYGRRTPTKLACGSESFSISNRTCHSMSNIPLARFPNPEHLQAYPSFTSEHGVQAVDKVTGAAAKAPSPRPGGHSPVRTQFKLWLAPIFSDV
jgi:hypothetical protein